MTRQVQSAIAALAVAIIGTAAHAETMTLLRDTWQDGDRSAPPAPAYSEAGVDADQDGDLESAWFNGGEGSILTATPGNLRMDPGASPATWTTYLTSEAGAFDLGINHKLLVTWRFRTGDVTALDTGQNFRIAMVDSFPNTRLTADAHPPAGSFLGLAMFGNMAETIGNANAFQLRERNNLPAGPLLEDSNAWLSVTEGAGNGLGAGAIGYADDTDYTFTMSIQLLLQGLDIEMTMAGGNIGGTGSVSLHVLDPSPITGTYDTFSIYVGGEGSSASFLDTKEFTVELDPIPEPASSALAAMSGLAVVALRRAGRRR